MPVKALKIVGAIVAALLLIAVLIGGYYGFVPGVSKAFGSNRPRDLGVKLTVDNAYGGVGLLGIPTTPKELEAGIKDPKSLRNFKARLTDDQASSGLLIGQSGIENWPLSVVQIRFNPDGTAEASGILNAAKAKPFMLGAGVPEGDAEKVMSTLSLAAQAPFYIKGTCSVQNNQVSLALDEVQFGRLSVPKSWYQGNEDRGTPYITNLLDSNGFKVKSLSTAGGTVQMEGTRPLSSLAPWLGMVGQYEPKEGE